jgi:hypothetical protein
MLRLASEAIPEKKKRNIIDGIGKEQGFHYLGANLIMGIQKYD